MGIIKIKPTIPVSEKVLFLKKIFWNSWAQDDVNVNINIWSKNWKNKNKQTTWIHIFSTKILSYFRKSQLQSRTVFWGTFCKFLSFFLIFFPRHSLLPIIREVLPGEMNTLVWPDTILFVLPCWGCLMQTKENLQYKFCISLSQLTSLPSSVACLTDRPLRHMLELSLQSWLLVLLAGFPEQPPDLGHHLLWGCQRTLLPALGSACGVQPLGMVPGEQEHCSLPPFYLTPTPAFYWQV